MSRDDPRAWRGLTANSPTRCAAQSVCRRMTPARGRPPFAATRVRTPADDGRLRNARVDTSVRVGPGFSRAAGADAS